MRWDGKFPPYDEAERRSAAMLEKFTDPKDRAQIYFQLVQIYGQTSGPPEKIIDSARKALQLPHGPPQRARLSIYLGEALFRLNPSQPVQERRRAALAAFLDGLMEIRMDRAVGSTAHVLEAPSTKSPLIKEQQSQQAINGHEPSGFSKEMEQFHDTLVGLIVQIYTSQPHATAELRAAALEKVNDPKFVDQLINQVETQIRADEAKYGPYDPPPETVELTPNADRNARKWWLIGNALFLGLLVVFLTMRRLGTRRLE